MNGATAIFRVGLLSAGVALAMLSQGVSAQEMDHSKMTMPMPAEKPAPAKPPVRKKAAAKPTIKPASTSAHAGHGTPTSPTPTSPTTKPKPAPKSVPVVDAAKTPSMPKPATQAPPMDHAAMGHDMPMPTDTVTPAEPMDHSAMGHDMAEPQPDAGPSMQQMDHSAMGHDMGTMPSEPAQPMDHSTMDHSAMEGMKIAPTEPITPLPAVTDADRAAAFPDLQRHMEHAPEVNSYVLLNRLEAWDTDRGTGQAWEGLAWIGTDLDRVWLRSEGERSGGHTESADLEVLYGRSVAPWWDVVAGIKHDFKPGSSQTWVAFGVQGLSPYKFEVQATAYVGESGRTAANFEVEYETLLTNRLILQSLVEVDLVGKDDPQRGIGSGLSTAEAGLRLRYEFTRKFAPYIGVAHERAFGGTADFRRAEGENATDTRVVAGVRIWF